MNIQKNKYVKEDVCNMEKAYLTNKNDELEGADLNYYLYQFKKSYEVACDAYQLMCDKYNALSEDYKKLKTENLMVADTKTEAEVITMSILEAKILAKMIIDDTLIETDGIVNQTIKDIERICVILESVVEEIQKLSSFCNNNTRELQ